MAQRVVISMTDDVDGSEAAETVTFGLDGTTYEIDLSDKNATALRKSLSKYVGVARKVSKGRPATSGRGKGAQGNGPAPRLVREWAKSHGLDVPDRGRIPQGVLEAYEAAH